MLGAGKRVGVAACERIEHLPIHGTSTALASAQPLERQLTGASRMLSESWAVKAYLPAPTNCRRLSASNRRGPSPTECCQGFATKCRLCQSTICRWLFRQIVVDLDRQTVVDIHSRP